MIMKDFMSLLTDGQLDSILKMLYGDSTLEIMKQKIRLTDVCEHFSKASPCCDDISVISVPAYTEIMGIPVFLSADKIIISGNDNKAVYVSDNIPKGFKPAKFKETEDIADCFSGYSICFSGVKKHTSRKRVPDTDYDTLCSLIEENEKRCVELCREALKIGDTAQFFRCFSDSKKHMNCNYKIQAGFIKSQLFIKYDGAVSADDNIITAFVPSYRTDEYVAEMDSIFGDGNCIAMKIRNKGESELTK
ncbi:MAG: hypothetical protein K2K91_11840 [Ruminococcus sp.]|nr:hypothetical protein [Ruminococcus sp.]